MASAEENNATRITSNTRDVHDGAYAPLILVTGASGFIAAHILNAFLSSGYRVRGTVRDQRSADKVRKTHARYGEGLSFVVVPDISEPGAFDDAVKGVDGVVHTASPSRRSVTDNEDELLRPAINGTKNILEAVQKNAPNVERVVITSSFGAVYDSKKPRDYVYTESDWNPITYEQALRADSSRAHSASKKFAEKTAYDFVELAKPNFTVATICPPLVYGPLEHDASLRRLNASTENIYRLMNGSQKLMPVAFLAFADVRDVADAHLRAYEHCTGGRFLVSGGNFNYRDVGEILRMVVSDPDQVPDLTEEEARDVELKIDGLRARTELKMEFRPLKETIIDTAKSLIQLQAAAGENGYNSA